MAYSSLKAIVEGNVCKKKNPYACSVRIENSVTRDNCSASLGKLRDAGRLIRDGIFNRHLITIKAKKKKKKKKNVCVFQVFQLWKH